MIAVGMKLEMLHHITHCAEIKLSMRGETSNRIHPPPSLLLGYKKSVLIKGGGMQGKG